MKYRREIDGLRAIAVVPVLLFHANLSFMSGGFLGVDIFFVISGYLITSILLEAQAEDRFSIRHFYARRARRILPALFLILLLCIPTAYLLLAPTQLVDFGQSLIATVGFGSNILFWLETGYFQAAAETKPLLHTWSLAVEEQYYLVFPILLLLLRPLGNIKTFLVLAGLLCLSFFACQWYSGKLTSTSFYLAHLRAWQLLLGALLAFSFVHEFIEQNLPHALREIGAAAGLILVIICMVVFDGYMGLPDYKSMIPTAATGLIIALATPQTLTGRLLGMPIFVGIGLISYSLYLWHQPLYAFARVWLMDEPALWQFSLLMLLAVALSYLTWKYLETPARSSQTISTQKIVAIAAPVALIILAVGALFIVKQGYPERFPNWSEYQAEKTLFKTLQDERLKGVRMAECDYYSYYISIDDFLEQWDCLPPKNDPHGIVIAGDSNAADKAMALREQGVNVGQMTGVGCTLVPGDLPDDCRRMYERLFALLQKRPDLTLWISNRWIPGDKEIRRFGKQIKYWTERGIRLGLIGPTVEYPGIEVYRPVHAGSGISRAAASNYHNTEAQARDYDQRLRMIADQAGIPYVSTIDDYCNLTETAVCSPVRDGEYLISDYAHFSILGAQEYGKFLLEAIREHQ